MTRDLGSDGSTCRRSPDYPIRWASRAISARASDPGPDREIHLFDDGWNALRKRIFENQKRLGVIPAGTELKPWPTQVLKNWDDLTPEEKKLFIRQAEVFAAYVAYSDHEIGGVIQAVEARPAHDRGEASAALARGHQAARNGPTS